MRYGPSLLLQDYLWIINMAILKKGQTAAELEHVLAVAVLHPERPPPQKRIGGCTCIGGKLQNAADYLTAKVISLCS